MIRLLAFCIAIFATPSCVLAQVELSFYAGAQSARVSDVLIRDPSSGPVSTSLVQNGRSFDAPLYYGIRATSWQSPTFGLGLDFAHNRIHASSMPANYDVLEMAHGLNTLTVNAYRRWNGVIGTLSPYVGGGIGIAAPHVELTNDLSQTLDYQLTGPAATWIAGASMPLNDQWSVFGEYKGTYSVNSVDLDSGGTLEADIMTNGLNAGVSFNF